MTVRLLTVALLAVATAVGAVEFPDSVSASKCKGKKKVFGFIDDPTSTPSVRKIKLPYSFYFAAGSAVVHACKTAKGSEECEESFDLSLFLTPGFTGEIPCFSQSGFPSINYFAGSGPEYTFWSSTGECSVTITKYDEERGRLKGMYHTEVVNVSAPTPVYGELVGCFSAKRQDIGVSAD